MLCLLSVALRHCFALLRFGLPRLALPCLVFKEEAPPLGSDTGSWAWPEGTHHATAGPYRGALLPLLPYRSFFGTDHPKCG